VESATKTVWWLK